MDRDYWLNRWIENRTGFHVKGANPLVSGNLTDSMPFASAPTGNKSGVERIDVSRDHLTVEDTDRSHFPGAHQSRRVVGNPSTGIAKSDMVERPALMTLDE